MCVRNRVSITPPAVDALVSKGHQIIIETQAGSGSCISNEDYTSAGATLSPDAKTVYQKGEMILKYRRLGSNIGHGLFVGWVEHPDIFCWVSPPQADQPTYQPFLCCQRNPTKLPKIELSPISDYFFGPRTGQIWPA